MLHDVQSPHEGSRHKNIVELITEAQVKTWQAVDEIATQIEPGMREGDAIKIAQKILVKMGSRKFWHKCHVRFGASTIYSFNDEYKDEVLKEDDLFYIDIGPVWNGIEGDGGKSVAVGNNSEYNRCVADVKIIFDEVRNHWAKHKVSGLELYNYADQKTRDRGWILAPSYVRGHRLSEFPHSFHSEFTLEQVDFHPAPQRWVLEVHICDSNMRFGAFHEDTLS